MFVIIGSIVVIASVIIGYTAHGGHLAVLWQPFEVLIICGAALGAFITANPKDILVRCLTSMGPLFKGVKYTKASYLELLTMMFAVFKVARTKGMLALEPHIENSHESTLFSQFPGFHHNHHAITFFCDHLRLLTLGINNVYQMDDLMTAEIEAHHEENHQVVHAISNVADGMPALGIVAAVLGVIHTMGSISEPPEVLGKLIGAALVGTFLGVLLSYGFIAPVARSLQNVFDADSRYMMCLKAGIVAYMQGHPPSIAVEFARKTLFGDVRPSFADLEEACNNTNVGV